MRSAAFVDAGYLCAAGTKLLTGTALRRSSVQLDIDAVLVALRGAVAAAAPSRSFLRNYWYDGMLRSGPTTEQETLADSDDVKLRLGMIGFTGRQKGVDSLIVTDLIELARNQAISDAVLLSGDEDVRIGVQIAQSYGVRVHLLGIEPAAHNQSRLLRQESDTTIEWQRSDVDALLSVRAVVEEAEQRLVLVEQPAIEPSPELDPVVRQFLGACSAEERTILGELQARDPIPPELDRRLLRAVADALGRFLESGERFYIRGAAKRLCRDVSGESG